MDFLEQVVPSFHTIQSLRSKLQRNLCSKRISNFHFDATQGLVWWHVSRCDIRNSIPCRSFRRERCAERKGKIHLFQAISCRLQYFYDSRAAVFPQARGPIKAAQHPLSSMEYSHCSHTLKMNVPFQRSWRKVGNEVSRMSGL